MLGGGASAWLTSTSTQLNPNTLKNSQVAHFKEQLYKAELATENTFVILLCDLFGFLREQLYKDSLENSFIPMTLFILFSLC